MEDKMKKLGNRIRLIRQAKGMSQETLANMCGNDSAHARSWISKIESGKRNPNMEDLYKIADALGVELSILFIESEPTSDYLDRALKYMVLFEQQRESAQ